MDKLANDPGEPEGSRAPWSTWFGDPHWSDDQSRESFPRLPSGYVKIAIENDHRNSVFSH